jgi:NAD(P)H dehydrogenase (quinone)
MNILIVAAHPSTSSFTHSISDSYLSRANELGHTVEVLDLYRSERQDFLAFDHEQNEKELSIRIMYQQKITWADELVFVHPMWWGSMPAIMKNWLDVNFSGGFSHTYKDGKAIPLLTDKKAKVFITSDAPAFVYTFLAKPYATTWSMIVLKFVGIQTEFVKLYGNKRKRSDEENTKFLNWVKSRVPK